MSRSVHQMPPELRELHQLEFPYASGKGIDFKPYPDFYSPDKVRSWLQAWTGNPSVGGSDYLVFGQDGTGGLAAFWLTRSAASILEQPVVFFGSEGAVGVVARNFADYLWLLAGGLGPFEAIRSPHAERVAQPQFVRFAEAHAPASKKSPSDVLAAARAEFPNYQQSVFQLFG